MTTHGEVDDFLLSRSFRDRSSSAMSNAPNLRSTPRTFTSKAHLAAQTSSKLDASGFKPSDGLSSPSSPSSPSSLPLFYSTESSKMYPIHEIITLPSLAPGMISGRIVEWRVEVGDMIRPGDIICEVMHGPHRIEMVSTQSGFLAKFLVLPAHSASELSSSLETDSSLSKNCITSSNYFMLDIPIGTALAVLAHDSSEVSSFTLFEDCKYKSIQHFRTKITPQVCIQALKHIFSLKFSYRACVEESSSVCTITVDPAIISEELDAPCMRQTIRFFRASDLEDSFIVQVQAICGEASELRASYYNIRRELSDWPGLAIHFSKSFSLLENCGVLITLLERYHDDADFFLSENDEVADEIISHIHSQIDAFAAHYANISIWTQSAAILSNPAQSLMPSTVNGPAFVGQQEVETPRGKTVPGFALWSYQSVPPLAKLCDSLIRWMAVPAVKQVPARAAAVVGALRCVTRNEEARAQFDSYLLLRDVMSWGPSHSVNHAPLQVNALALISNLCATEANRQTTNSAGLLPHIAIVMDTHCDDRSIQDEACFLVSRLASGEQAHFRTFTFLQRQNNIIPRILRALAKFSLDSDIQANGCMALRNLSMSELAEKKIIELRGLNLIFLAIHNHPRNIQVQKEAISALHNLVCDHASHVAIMRDRVFGVRFIAQLLHRWRRSPELLIKLCRLIRNLAHTAHSHFAPAFLARRLVVGDPIGFYRFDKLPNAPIPSPPCFNNLSSSDATSTIESAQQIQSTSSGLQLPVPQASTSFVTIHPPPSNSFSSISTSSLSAAFASNSPSRSPRSAQSRSLNASSSSSSSSAVSFSAALPPPSLSPARSETNSPSTSYGLPRLPSLSLSKSDQVSLNESGMKESFPEDALFRMIENTIRKESISAVATSLHHSLPAIAQTFSTFNISSDSSTLQHALPSLASLPSQTNSDTCKVQLMTPNSANIEFNPDFKFQPDSSSRIPPISASSFATASSSFAFHQMPSKLLPPRHSQPDGLNPCEVILSTPSSSNIEFDPNFQFQPPAASASIMATASTSFSTVPARPHAASFSTSNSSTVPITHVGAGHHPHSLSLNSVSSFSSSSVANLSNRPLNLRAATMPTATFLNPFEAAPVSVTSSSFAALSEQSGLKSNTVSTSPSMTDSRQMPPEASPFVSTVRSSMHYGNLRMPAVRPALNRSRSEIYAPSQPAQLAPPIQLPHANIGNHPGNQTFSPFAVPALSANRALISAAVPSATFPSLRPFPRAPSFLSENSLDEIDFPSSSSSSSFQSTASSHAEPSTSASSPNSFPLSMPLPFPTLAATSSSSLMPPPSLPPLALSLSLSADISVSSPPAPPPTTTNFMRNVPQISQPSSSSSNPPAAPGSALISASIRPSTPFSPSLTTRFFVDACTFDQEPSDLDLDHGQQTQHSNQSQFESKDTDDHFEIYRSLESSSGLSLSAAKSVAINDSLQFKKKNSFNQSQASKRVLRFEDDILVPNASIVEILLMLMDHYNWHPDLQVAFCSAFTSIAACLPDNALDLVQLGIIPRLMCNLQDLPPPPPSTSAELLSSMSLFKPPSSASTHSNTLSPQVVQAASRCLCKIAVMFPWSNLAWRATLSERAPGNQIDNPLSSNGDLEQIPTALGFARSSSSALVDTNSSNQERPSSISALVKIENDQTIWVDWQWDPRDHTALSSSSEPAFSFENAVDLPHSKIHQRTSQGNDSDNENEDSRSVSLYHRHSKISRALGNWINLEVASRPCSMKMLDCMINALAVKSTAILLPMASRQHRSCGFHFSNSHSHENLHLSPYEHAISSNPFDLILHRFDHRLVHIPRWRPHAEIPLPPVSDSQKTSQMSASLSTQSAASLGIGLRHAPTNSTPASNPHFPMLDFSASSSSSNSLGPASASSSTQLPQLISSTPPLWTPNLSFNLPPLPVGQNAIGKNAITPQAGLMTPFPASSELNFPPPMPLSFPPLPSMSLSAAPSVAALSVSSSCDPNPRKSPAFAMTASTSAETDPCVECLPKLNLLHLRTIIYSAVGFTLPEDKLTSLSLRPEEMNAVARLLIMCGVQFLPSRKSPSSSAPKFALPLPPLVSSPPPPAPPSLQRNHSTARIFHLPSFSITGNTNDEPLFCKPNGEDWDTPTVAPMEIPHLSSSAVSIAAEAHSRASASHAATPYGCLRDLHRVIQYQLHRELASFLTVATAQSVPDFSDAVLSLIASYIHCVPPATQSDDSSALAAPSNQVQGSESLNSSSHLLQSALYQ